MTGDQMIESGARAIARSQGHDPDDLAPRAMMCTADNQQVQWWRVFEEQAEACLADATVRIEALEAQLQDNSERYGNKIASRIEALEAALREAERFMAYFADGATSFVGPGTPTSCLATIRAALELG
jgi:hypothetical protein